MRKLIIHNGIVLTPFQTKRDIAVQVIDGQIDRLITENEIPKSGFQVLDAHRCYICPGFVDIHVHGGGGSDFMDATETDLATIMRFHSTHGTTALVATSVSAPFEQLAVMLNLVRRYQGKPIAGCRLLGAHLEGPFLSEINRGAHIAQYLKVPQTHGWQFINGYLDVLKLVTVSPELTGCSNMICDLSKKGIVISGGHDDALDDEISIAIDAGMRHITHVFCATSTIRFKHSQRQAGLAILSMIDDRLSVEMIADNRHLTPEMVKLIYMCKGADKVCVVSDCIRAGGMPIDGTTYSLGPRDTPEAHQAIVADGVACLPDRSRYAGSITPLSMMVKNMVFDCDIPLADAVRMASTTPAAIIGMQETIGSITPGKKADFCLLDSKLDVDKTLVDGQSVFDRIKHITD